MSGASRGFTLWLTGLSGAGKSTLARALAGELGRHGRRVEVLDGDEVRRAFGDDLGHTPADRTRNMRRLGYMAGLLSRHDVIVIVAAMSPYRAVQQEIRSGHQAPFIEVFVDCAMDELMRRDTKGLYARARAGEIANLIGVHEAYEPPADADVHVRTDRESLAEAVTAVLVVLRERRLLPASRVYTDT